MKPGYIAALLLAISSASLFSQERHEVLEMWANPEPYLEAIRKNIRESPVTGETDDALADRIQGLAYSINQEIILAESEDWSSPSPERIRVIQKWGRVLAPYAGELVTLAIGGRKTREAPSVQARSILDFAAPTEEFEKAVRAYIDDDAPQNLAAAVDLLYEHRLASAADMDTLGFRHQETLPEPGG